MIGRDVINEPEQYSNTLDDSVTFRLHFFGNYQEPPYDLKIDRMVLKDLAKQEHLVCEFKYDFERYEWV